MWRRILFVLLLNVSGLGCSFGQINECSVGQLNGGSVGQLNGGSVGQIKGCSVGQINECSFGQINGGSVGQHRPRVAVVLSGGGAKGMAHIGALKVVERAGIPVDIITGTSMGSIVGGLYAIGHHADALDSLVRKQDWKFLLSDMTELRSPLLDERKKQNTYFFSKTALFVDGKLQNKTGGIIEGRNLAQLFNSLCSQYDDSISFSDLPIPFACVATNIIDNSEYDFHSGHLPEAMRASMSIPGVFSPVRKGDKVLVDGGLRNNFPVDIAKSMGADYVIGVTVQSAPKTADDLQTSAQILSQIVDVNCKNKYDDNLNLTDVAIMVNTKGYSAASFNAVAIDTLIRRGEEEAMKHWDDLMALKEKLKADSAQVETEDKAWSAPLQTTDTEQNRNENPFAEVAASTDQKGLVVAANLGVRFDTEEIVAMQINGHAKPLSSPFELAATLRLGKRIMGRLDLGFVPLDHSKILLSYIFHHNDLNIYYDGDRDFNAVYNQHSAQLSLWDFNIKNFNFEFGSRFDYFRFNDILLGADVSKIAGEMRDTHYFRYYAEVKYNSEDNWNFPTRGAKFDAHFNYYTDNFYKYNDHVGFSSLDAMWRMSFAASRAITFQPMFYGRMLFGSDIHPTCFNVIGGNWFSHYVEQQLPFAGVGHIDFVEDKIVAAQIRTQYRMTENNYLIARVATAFQSDEIESLFDSKPIFGAQLSYCYNTMFGPLGATVGYSTKTKKPLVYVNLGFQF